MKKTKPINRPIFFGRIIVVLIIIVLAAYFITPLPEEELILEVVGSPNIDLSTVPDLDMEQYEGLWYEVARYDHQFEEGCECVTANYKIIEANQRVEVTNTCYRNGVANIASGKAYPTEVPGILSVQFFPLTMSQYRILYVDNNYEYALVSDENLDYFWMLSRVTPEEADINKLKKAAEERGINTFKLILNEEC